MNLNFMRPILWVAFRLLRRWAYTLLGRNPLVRGNAAPSFAFEVRSVQGLLASLRKAPARLESDDPRLELWSTALGPLWTPKGVGGHFVGMLVAEMNAGVYDLSRLPEQGRGSIIIDAGANVGVFARWALQRGVGKVICFEPSPQNAECLRRNLATAIASGAAVTVSKGLWDTTTTLSFSTQNQINPGGHHIAEDGSGDISIAVTSLDEIRGELGLSRLDYIKMDIEGAEQRALAGAEKTIAMFHPQFCIVTEHTEDLYANTVAVIARMSAAGYRYSVTEAHVYHSPSRGKVLTPYSLLFRPAK